jgi:hypothetical protein
MLQIVAGGDSFGSGSASCAAPVPSATMTARTQNGTRELVERTIDPIKEVYPSDPDRASEIEIRPRATAG